jgi:PAS domain S-box-containing protein
MRDAFRSAILFALAFLAAAEVGRLFSPVAGHFATIWPPAGLYVAVLLATRIRRWPSLVAAAVLANLASDCLLHDQPLNAALGFAAANTIEALTGAVLIRRWFGSDFSLDRLHDVLGWTLVAALAAPALGAAVATGVVALAFGSERLAATWWTWWMADVVSVMVIGPLAWWALRAARPWWRRTVKLRLLEGAAMLLCVAVVVRLIWSEIGLYPYVLVPLFLWPAIRFGFAAVALCSLLLLSIAFPATLQGIGPFPYPRFASSEALLLAQMAACLYAFSFYVLAAIFAERTRAMAALRIANSKLEAHVRQRTAELEYASSGLREQRNLYEAVVRTSGHVLYDMDMITKRVRYGGDCKRILGYTAEELEGDVAKWQEMVHADDRAHFLRAIDATAQAPGLHIEYRLRRRDGVHILVQDDAQLVASARPGGASHLIGFVKDVTAQREAQTALLNSERRLRQLTEAMPQIVWVSLPNGDIEYLSRRWVELTGVAAEDSMGKAWIASVHPDDLPRISQRWVHSAKTGEVYEAETRYRRSDGSYRWYLTRAVPLDERDGKVLRWVGIALDIDEAKQLTEALRRSEERFRVAQEVSLFGFSILRGVRDAAGRIVDFEVEYMNPAAAAMAGRPAGELIGRRMLEAFPSSNPATGIFDNCVRVVESGQAEDVELRYEREGMDAWFRNMAVKLGDGVAVSFTDITQRKELEAALRLRNLELLEADRRKDEFLATLAHELRNPLAPIRNSLQIMRLAGNRREHLEQARDMMERQVAQMVRLIDDLLDISRVSHNRLHLRKEHVDLATVVKSAIETSRPLIEERRHELIVRLPAQAVPLHADPTRLAQVLLNLLNNAAKYTEPGGRIELAAERQAARVTLRVKDNGIGIPADLLPGIFDMFTQVDNSPERSQGGLGIGLTLAQRLVELHGGTIEAISMRSRGSEFVVTLPVAEGLNPVAMPAGPTMAHSSRARRILVVDDNRDAAESLATMLEIMGNQTHTAFDGPAALAATERLRPDILLLDIGLPEINGYDVARRIRNQIWGKDIVLIALTGWGQAEDRRRSLEAGFDAHLVKPVDPKELEEMMEELRPEAA